MNRYLILLALLFPAPLAQASQRADAIGVDGIYEGTIGMQLSNRKGAEYKAPAKFVYMPDGKGAVLTAEHPEGVVAVVMRGNLRGRTFHAKSEGKLDYGGYTQAMTWTITFDPKAATATLYGKVKNLPKWAKDDDLRYVFKKKAKR